MVNDKFDIVGNGLELLGAGINSQEKNREKSKDGYGQMLDAHLLVIGVVGNVLLRKQLCIGKTNDSITGRLCLIGSFVQGIDLCESSISYGLYVQAATLLKQEMETVAAINEYSTDRRADGGTPNISNIDWGLNRLYDDLNKLAHVADKLAINPLFQAEVNEVIKPVSLVPIYDKQVSRRLFGLHVVLLIQLSRCIESLYKDMYDEIFLEDEYLMLFRAFQLMINEGWLVDNEEEAKNPDWPIPKNK